VWSRNPANAKRFAEQSQIAVEVAPTVRAAVDGADLICTTTASREPFVEGAWLAPGAHINAVGACFPTTRELDTAAVARSRLIVDNRQSALAESGEFLLAAPTARSATITSPASSARCCSPDRRPARQREVTLFKSLGIAVEDLAAAHYVYTQAVARGGGVSVPLGA